MAEEVTSAMNTEDFSLNEYLMKQDIEDRKIHLDCDIDETAYRMVSYWILRYNQSDRDIPVEKRKPIYLYIESDGGSVTDGWGILSAMAASKTPIITVTTSKVYSMASYIFLAGTKRYMFPYASMCIHDGSTMVANSSSKVRDTLDFYANGEEKLHKFIIEHTNVSEDELEKKSRVEWYLWADECKEKGICDGIVGIDVPVDEVLPS